MIIITNSSVVINADNITTMGIIKEETNMLMINGQRVSFETNDEMMSTFTEIIIYMKNSSNGLIIDMRE